MPPLRDTAALQKIRVLQVCDHLGWEGSRMHGVKRLFAWMIPRFDPARFEVSLVSLRKKDLSEETLDALGIDITYLHKSKFDPATLPALLKIIDRKKIDVLHLHGYGATTFGRMAAAMRGIPAILHEHANLTDTPWFQKVADRLLERYTDIAIAVSKSTADFVDQGAAGAAREGEGRLPRRAARRVQPSAIDRRDCQPRGASSGSRPAISPSAPSRGCTSRKAIRISSMPRGSCSIGNRTRSSFWSARGRSASRSKRRPGSSASAIGSCSSGLRATSPAVLSAFDLSVFPSLWEGTPLTAFEALASGKPIVATDADGLLDILTDGRDARIVPKRNAPALADAIVDLIDRPDERARLAAAARVTAQRYDITAFVRKMEQLYVLLCDGSRATKAGSGAR